MANETRSQRSRAVMTVGVAICVLLLIGACGDGLTHIDASPDTVVGTWRGTDGTQLALNGDNTFTTRHWPTATGPASTYRDFSGTWTTGKVGNAEIADVILDFGSFGAPVGPPGVVNLVSTGGPHALCVEEDPDELCPHGLLTPVG